MNVSRPNQGIRQYTNFGANTVDLATPSVSLESGPKETFTLSGTGFACATATGMAAAHLSADPELGYDDVSDLLLAQPEIVPAGTTERALAAIKPEVPGILTKEFWTSDLWRNQMP